MCSGEISNDKRSSHSSCLVCDGESLKDKFVVDGYTVTKCDKCGLKFVREQLTQEDLDVHYSKIKGDVYLDKENIENLNFFYNQLKKHIVKIHPTGSILDVGCSAGSFLDVMDGFDRFGVERNVSRADVARQKYGDKIFIGTIEEYTPPEGMLFDCITLQDVLDHMVDPEAVLKKCYSLLKPGGTIAVKVHDYSSLFAKITGKNYYAIIPPTHLIYFNRNSLRVVFEKVGFAVTKMKHIPHILFFSTIFLRLSKGNTNNLFYKIYLFLKETRLGKMRIRKNLFDIVTVFGSKKGE